MFWNKKQKTEVAVKEKNEVKVKDLVIPTKDIVSNELINFDDMIRARNGELTDSDHLNKYLSVLERQMPMGTQINRGEYYTMEAMHDVGFNLFIRHSAILKFKYAAEVWSDHYNPTVSYNEDKYSKDNRVVLFTGDIPEFALDRIKLVKSVKCSYVLGKDRSPIHAITIHSNTELPCQYVEMEYRDPVLIAWRDAPEIVLTKKGCYLREDIIYPDRNGIGVVLAMWGDDGQPL